MTCSSDVAGGGDWGAALGAIMQWLAASRSVVFPVSSFQHVFFGRLLGRRWLPRDVRPCVQADGTAGKGGKAASKGRRDREVT